MRERVIWLLRLSRCLSCGTKLKWISTSSLATQPAHRVCLHPAPTTTPILCHARPCIAPEFKAWLQQPLFVTVIAYGMSRDQLRTPHFETPHPPFCGRCQEGTMAGKQQIIFPEPEDEVIVEARRFWSSVAMYPPPTYLPSLNPPPLSLCVRARALHFIGRVRHFPDHFHSFKTRPVPVIAMSLCLIVWSHRILGKRILVKEMNTLPSAVTSILTLTQFIPNSVAEIRWDWDCECVGIRNMNIITIKLSTKILITILVFS